MNERCRPSLLWACLLLTAGCAAQRPALVTDIVAVRTYRTDYPFVSLDTAGDPNPEGIKLVYYAVSAGSQLGESADGLIRIKLYVVRSQPDGQLDGVLVKTWEFTPQAARGWRTRQRSVMGQAYQFTLDWADADVYGHEVRFVPEFVRRDGVVITGPPQRLQVPPLRRRVRLTDG